MSPASLASPAQWGGAFLKQLTTVKPKQPKVTVGLDIGSSSVKAVALGSRKTSASRPVLGSRAVPLNETSESEASSAIKEAISPLHVPGRHVNLSVSGQWVIMRVVEMPVLKTHELAQALPFEAQRYLPFNIQDVMLDGAILGPAEKNKLWVLIVACKRELLERRIGWIKQAGYEPALVDVDALAIMNAYGAQANGKKAAGAYALLNVGAQWTNLIVVKSGVPYLVRDIPWGSVKLVRHMAETLGLEEAPIVAQLKQEGPLPAEVLQSVKTTTESLTADLQLSFDFFESRFGQPPDQLLVSGGLSRCPGFVEALKRHLAQPLAAWEPAAGLGSEFAVAYGLALRSAES